jgi:asparagine synthase (glutamine-hydrolysing)
VRRRLVRPLVAAMPHSLSKQSLDYKLRKFIEGAELPPAKAHYTWRTIFSDQDKPQLLSRDFLKTIDDVETADCFQRYFTEAKAVSEMNKIFYADFKVFLPDSILPKVDSMTMAHSLEAREPLLDYRLVELSTHIPERLKIKGLDTKYIFKQAMARYLPRQIVFRKKAGFHPPMAQWFRYELRSFVDEVLCTETLGSSGMLNVPYVEELKRRHFAGTENNAFKLWGLMNFVTWHRLLLKGF